MEAAWTKCRCSRHLTRLLKQHDIRFVLENTLVCALTVLRRGWHYRGIPRVTFISPLPAK